MKALVKKYPGKVPLVLCITTEDGKAVFIDTAPQYSVTVTAGLLEELSLLLGDGHYKIKPSDKVPHTDGLPASQWLGYPGTLN